MWPQVHRILRHGGTAAFWVYLLSQSFKSNLLKWLSSKVYTEFRLSNYPTLTPLITAYAQGSDIHTSLGPHFQRPGRTILERHLIDVPEPSSILKDGGLEKLHRAFFCGELCLLLFTNILMRNQVTMFRPSSHPTHRHILS